MPIQGKVETSFISRDLFSEGETKRDSACGIARHMSQNATKKCLKSHLFECSERLLFSFALKTFAFLEKKDVNVPGISTQVMQAKWGGFLRVSS